MLADNEDNKASRDQLTMVISILFIVYGILGITLLALSANLSQFWFVGSLFIVIGVAFYFFTTDIAKTILGIIGLIGSFYAATIWADHVQSPLSGAMTLFSMILLALCFGAVCHVTCTWPNLDYD